MKKIVGYGDKILIIMYVNSRFELQSDQILYFYSNMDMCK